MRSVGSSSRSTARRLGAGCIAMALLALGAPPTRAGDAFWRDTRFVLLDARARAIERDTIVEQPPPRRSLAPRTVRTVSMRRDPIVSPDAPIQFRIVGPLAADGAPGLAFEVRF